MTVPVTNEQHQESRRWARRRGPLGDHVARIVGRLQERYVSDRPHPQAVAALAKLRRCVGREPGFDYTVEEYVAVPDSLLDQHGSTGQATDAEYAQHCAVTLYALHQQSRRERMHVDQRGLGLSVAELSRTPGISVDGVRRRFASLGTATTYDETIHHLRSIVVMLRDRQIPLDYGLLADDLSILRRPGGRARLQAAWGREFFRSRPNRSDDTDTTKEN